MIRSLAWYLSGLFAVACLLQSFITVVPGAQTRFSIVQGICLAFALGFAALGMFVSRMSANHWLRRSASVRVALLVFAAVCTVMVLFGTIG